MDSQGKFVMDELNLLNDKSIAKQLEGDGNKFNNI